MKTDAMIAVSDFCLSHNVDVAFISSLHQIGLIQVATHDDRMFIDANQLPQLEMFVCFHYELDINLEGIDALTHLLHRVCLLQDEITMFKNRLRLYEINE
jgi:chaperone modulatory protein CbpM